MTTALYERMMAMSAEDRDNGELMQRVWSPTPFLVDIYSGATDTRRDREILVWCFDTFGNESSPIHGNVGRWRRGNATVFGWTWFGFSTREEMEQFEARWPNPPNAVRMPLTHGQSADGGSK